MIAWIYRWLNYDKAAELSVESDEQCLLHAAKVGDADTLQSLISKGCSVNAYNPQVSWFFSKFVKDAIVVLTS